MLRAVSMESTNSVSCYDVAQFGEPAIQVTSLKIVLIVK
jgi:hypothetical protein